MHCPEKRLYVCEACFENATLRKRITRLNHVPDSTCPDHPEENAVSIEDVSEIFREAIETNYVLGDIDPLGEQRGSDLEEIIWDIGGIENDDVVRSLVDAVIALDDYWPPDGGEPFLSHDFCYERIADGLSHYLSARWREFRTHIMVGRRFLSGDAREMLEDIFRDLHLLKDAEGNCPAYALKPGQHTIVRGRRANARAERERIEADPAKELGPPPERLRSAGRMNPSGIRALYGAFDGETCAAELRPAVGETIILGRFDLLRPILVLDLTQFDRPTRDRDVFDENNNDQLARWQFMRRFMWEAARPYLPGDEHLDYVPTQVVAEFLTHENCITYEGESRPVEGVVFRSAQNAGGKNVVLFGGAALIENGSALDASNASSDPFDMSDQNDRPIPALRFIEGSVETCRVRKVEVTTTAIEQYGHDSMLLEDVI